MDATLQIDERRVGNVTILTLAGPLILPNEGMIRGWINNLVVEGHTRILLDLAGVTRLDSAGMGILAAKFVTIDRAGGALKLLRPTERAIQVLTMTRLDTMFEVFASEDDAIRSFK